MAFLQVLLQSFMSLCICAVLHDVVFVNVSIACVAGKAIWREPLHHCPGCSIAQSHIIVCARVAVQRSVIIGRSTLVCVPWPKHTFWDLHEKKQVAMQTVSLCIMAQARRVSGVSHHRMLTCHCPPECHHLHEHAALCDGPNTRVLCFKRQTTTLPIDMYCICIIAMHQSVAESDIIVCASMTLKRSVVVHRSMHLHAMFQTHLLGVAYVCGAAVVFFVCTIILIVVSVSYTHLTLPTIYSV